MVLIGVVLATQGRPVDSEAIRKAWPKTVTTQNDSGFGQSLSETSASAFVGREHELSQALTALSGQPPSGLLLLLGPPRVGKTAFLTELSRRLTERGAGVAYVHTRQHGVRDPASMAQALAAAAAGGWLRPHSDANLSALAGALDRLRSGCSASFTGAGPTCPERRRVPYSPQSRQRGGGSSSLAAPAPALLEALRLLDAALDAVPDGAPRPVLILDDAAALKDWNIMQAASQAALLQWLLYVGGEARSAHVVLASGDPGFLGWAGGVFNPSYFTSEVLGELTAPEALEYLKRLVPPEHHATLAGNASAIYEVCGGNPGVLQRCAAAFQGDWREAALRSTKDIRRAVRAAMSPSPNDGWARWQFAKAVTAVLAGPADQAALAEAMGRNGMWVLQAMAGRGLFALRPYSAWQRDVPAAAWAIGSGSNATVAVAGDGDDGVLAVAPSGAALYGMRQLRMPPAEELIKEEEAAEGRHREYRRWEEESREHRR